MKKRILTCCVAVFALVSVNVCTGFKLDSSDDAKYCGTGSFTEESETINYYRKETTSYSMKGDVPCYYRQTSDSSCANVAGTIIIGYYDRYCEELIPNFTSYIQLGPIFSYKMISFESQAVMEKLYSLMETDVGSPGTSYDGFQKGMNSYVNSCGYSYSIQDLGNLDFNKYKSAVESNKPVAVFLSNYSLALTGQDDGSTEIIKSHHSAVAHVVVGCGYKVDTYYNSNNQVIATRTYLKVASGLDFYDITYLCLDGKSKIDKATSITIQ